MMEGTVGADGSGLNWNTLLAFAVVWLASMQGVLGMESVTCRISYKKAQFMAVLEFLEVVVVIAAEAVSFVELRGALNARIQWLQWLPGTILALGLLELLLDVMFMRITLQRSRKGWIPFSAIGSVKNYDINTQFLVELPPMVLTLTVSLFLLGWRKRWWLRGIAVGAEKSVEAARKIRALSTGAFAGCVTWAFVLIVVALLFVGWLLARNYEYKGELLPRTYEYNGDDNYEWSELQQYKTVYEIEHNSPYAGGGIGTGAISRALDAAPLHMGNAIVGKYKSHVFEDVDFGFSTILKWTILVTEHLSILPLQICVVVGVIQMHDKLDAPTFEALKEIVDAIIIVGVVEVAFALKKFLWGVGHPDVVHRNDRTPDEPVPEYETPGCLKKLWGRIRNSEQKSSATSESGSMNADAV